jgi:hypothetical protein
VQYGLVFAVAITFGQIYPVVSVNQETMNLGNEVQAIGCQDGIYPRDNFIIETIEAQVFLDG